MADPVGDGLRPTLVDRLAAVLPALGQALLLVSLVLLILWPRPVWGEAADGGHLFDLHCAGCHPGGGNIIRRGRGLHEATLRRQGIEGAAAVAAIAATGIGRMDGYASALGEGGADRVGAWVWRQALAGWPREPEPAPLVPIDAAASVPSATRREGP